MGTSNPKLPFWVHQLVEYGIGIIVVYEAVRSRRPTLPAVSGAALIVLAATAHGPAAAFGFVSRRLHRIVDLVVAGALLIAAVVLHRFVDGIGLGLVLGSAATLVGLNLRTDFRTRVRVKKPKPTPVRVAPAAPRASAVRPIGRKTGSQRSEDVGRKAGRIVAGGVRVYRRSRANRQNGSNG